MVRHVRVPRRQRPLPEVAHIALRTGCCDAFVLAGSPAVQATAREGGWLRFGPSPTLCDVPDCGHGFVVLPALPEWAGECGVLAARVSLVHKGCKKATIRPETARPELRAALARGRGPSVCVCVFLWGVRRIEMDMASGV